MKLTIIESPYAADTRQGIEANVAYACECERHSFSLGEAPYLSHLLYPLVLDDTIPEERALGIMAGQAWMLVAEQVAVYIDRGISPGMQLGIDAAHQAGVPVVMRSLA